MVATLLKAASHPFPWSWRKRSSEQNFSSTLAKCSFETKKKRKVAKDQRKWRRQTLKVLPPPLGGLQLGKGKYRIEKGWCRWEAREFHSKKNGRQRPIFLSCVGKLSAFHRPFPALIPTTGWSVEGELCGAVCSIVVEYEDGIFCQSLTSHYSSWCELVWCAL